MSLSIIVVQSHQFMLLMTVAQSCPSSLWSHEPQHASLSITNSQSPPKPMSIELVMPSNHLILCHPLLLLPSIFPSIRVFSNESALCISGQSIGVLASTSVLPMNTKGWSPLGWTGWIFLQSEGLSRVFSNTTVQQHQFFSAQLSYEEGNGTLLQYSCLKNPMDEGAWWATVQGVAKSRTRLSDFTFTFHFHALEK